MSTSRAWPKSNWLMFMRWHDLAFLHWRAPVEAIRAQVPARLELDLCDGECWVGVVPFWMSNVTARYLPPIPGMSTFPEMNVRTYVRCNGKPGVWFFTLDATNPIAVRGARWLFHLNYQDAKMDCVWDEGWFEYRSDRVHPGSYPGHFRGRYRPVGPVFSSQPGSLLEFITERYYLFSADKRGRIYSGKIAHRRWPLQDAQAEIDSMNLFGQLGLPEPSEAPLAHYCSVVDVPAWAIVPE